MIFSWLLESYHLLGARPLVVVLLRPRSLECRHHRSTPNRTPRHSPRAASEMHRRGWWGRRVPGADAVPVGAERFCGRVRLPNPGGAHGRAAVPLVDNTVHLYMWRTSTYVWFAAQTKPCCTVLLARVPITSFYR